MALDLMDLRDKSVLAVRDCEGEMWFRTAYDEWFYGTSLSVHVVVPADDLKVLYGPLTDATDELLRPE